MLSRLLGSRAYVKSNLPTICQWCWKYVGLSCQDGQYCWQLRTIMDSGLPTYNSKQLLSCSQVFWSRWKFPRDAKFPISWDSRMMTHAKTWKNAKRQSTIKQENTYGCMSVRYNQWRRYNRSIRRSGGKRKHHYYDTVFQKHRDSSLNNSMRRIHWSSMRRTTQTKIQIIMEFVFFWQHFQ